MDSTDERREKRRSPIPYIILTAVVLAGGYGAFYFWGAKYLATGSSIGVEGAKFGAGKNNQDCLKEAVQRYQSKDPALQKSIEGGFVIGCLNASVRVKDFCKDIPPVNLLNQSPARNWQMAQCQKYGLEGEACTDIFAQVQNYCMFHN